MKYKWYSRLFLVTVLFLLSYPLVARSFDLGFNLKFGGKSGGYTDLQSRMVWLNYTPTPGTYAFGNHSTATNTDKIFTLSNPGNDVLEAASLAVAGTGFSLQSTTCGTNPFDLALLTTCTATVRFSPVSGTLYTGTITASAPNLTSQVVNLSGTGVVPPVAPTTPVISVTPGDTTNLIALTSGGAGSPTPSYDVKWGTVAGTRSNTISGVTLPYTHTGRTNGTPYYYSVVATNSGGSAESSEVSGTPIVPIPYLVNQNFEVATTGYDNGETWLTTNTGGLGTINPIYTPALLGGQSLQLISGSANDSAYYAYTNFTANTHVYFAFIWKPVSFTSADSGLFTLNVNGTGNELFSVYKGTNSHIKIWDGSVRDSGYTVSAGTTYYVWGEWVKGTGSNAVINLYVSTTNTKPSVTYSVTNSTANGFSGSSAGKIVFMSRQTGSNIFDNIRVSTQDIP